MKVYKITDKDNCTNSGRTLWGENVTLKREGKGELDLLPKRVLRCYRDPYLAVFMSPIYDKYNPIKLWEAETTIIIYDDGTMSDVRELTTIRQIPLPELTIEQRVKIAAKCALQVCNEGTKLFDWSLEWVTGTNRSSASAWDAAIDAKATNPIVWRAAGAAALLGMFLEHIKATDRNAGNSGIWNTRVFARVEALAAEAAILTAVALGDDMGYMDIIDTIHHVIVEDNYIKSRIGEVEEKVDEQILEQNMIGLREAARNHICTWEPPLDVKPTILHFLENAPFNRRAAVIDEMVKHLAAENSKLTENVVWSNIMELKKAGKVTISRAQDSNAKVVKLV